MGVEVLFVNSEHSHLKWVNESINNLIFDLESQQVSGDEYYIGNLVSFTANANGSDFNIVCKVVNPVLINAIYEVESTLSDDPFAEVFRKAIISLINTSRFDSILGGYIIRTFVNTDIVISNENGLWLTHEF